MTQEQLDWWNSLPTCETCGEKITGSHYHCSCGTPDITSMYGHHTSFCRDGSKKKFHHCGPNGDCELSK